MEPALQLLLLLLLFLLLLLKYMVLQQQQQQQQQRGALSPCCRLVTLNPSGWVASNAKKASKRDRNLWGWDRLLPAIQRKWVRRGLGQEWSYRVSMRSRRRS